jgi:hypothetical protein
VKRGFKPLPDNPNRLFLSMKQPSAVSTNSLKLARRNLRLVIIAAAFWISYYMPEGLEFAGMTQPKGFVVEGAADGHPLLGDRP